MLSVALQTGASFSFTFFSSTLRADLPPITDFCRVSTGRQADQQWQQTQYRQTEGDVDKSVSPLTRHNSTTISHHQCAPFQPQL
jgi:hypothetical protein